MDKKITWIIIAIVAAGLLVGGVYWLYTAQHAKQVKLEAFAGCISGSGAKFYGAFWCAHCQEQKALFKTFFETAEKDLPYVECSTPDSNGQLQICIDETIKAYPTWKFADGSVHRGLATLQELADKTGCQLP